MCTIDNKLCNILLVSYENNDSATIIAYATESCQTVFNEKPEWHESSCRLLSFDTNQEIGVISFISRIVCYGIHYVSDFKQMKIPLLPSPPRTPSPPPPQEEVEQPPLPSPVKSTPKSPPRRMPRPVQKKRPPVVFPEKKLRWVSAPGRATPTGFRLNRYTTPYELYIMRANPDKKPKEIDELLHTMNITPTYSPASTQQPRG